MSDGKEERVLNQEETLAAREKQKQIKEQFKGWLFTDPDRTERLVRLYNDTYNNLRLRAFDGSHLAFPGMSQAITLASHQKAAVWRVMSSGNTLLAHAVGAENLRNGRSRHEDEAGRSPYQTPLCRPQSHAGAVWPRVHAAVSQRSAPDCWQGGLYPRAPKLLTAKMASGTWDGIIVTHSSFERIGMSRDYQERFLREQIAEYDQLLCDSAAADTSRAHRNIIKTIEKQRPSARNGSKTSWPQRKKTTAWSLTNWALTTSSLTKATTSRISKPRPKWSGWLVFKPAAVNAFDLYMKARFLHQQHPGHGVTFATGTPISNTMVEMYTIQRYLDPDGLSSAALTTLTPGPPPSAKSSTPWKSPRTVRASRSRFAKFSNLPELQQMFRAFADVQTAQMLNLPRPRLQGEKAIVIACPMSEAQYAIQESLVSHEAIRSGKVKPWKIMPWRSPPMAETCPRCPAPLSPCRGLPRLKDQRPDRERLYSLAGNPFFSRNTVDFPIWA